jgi:hypothetical protein
MEAHVAVDTTLYRPEFSSIPFAVSLNDAVVKLKLPAWDTHRSFSDSDSDSVEVGRIGNVSAKGSYTFYSAPRPDHQETLKLHLEVGQILSFAYIMLMSRVSAFLSRRTAGLFDVCFRQKITTLAVTPTFN